ncbi:capsular exopolysaccharide family [Paenibacillus sp. UNCCL117]|uniref:CpsD/CapB family tyrosine-protein kinase n=1 Tax=unclassified Paenibacillus TaxID=185978 RepID=UPI00088D5068|nr:MULTISPECIES: CpsD/CapB family tyrosine-protein kinase [unclassified Paenibacillus]SDC02544.1 capsular exopolysaccharide family [Paenibacillus sp. cl123]SFW36876.1 capsular exopolysaccharide family [Paenibacillus sp. UNCCL117]
MRQSKTNEASQPELPDAYVELRVNIDFKSSSEKGIGTVAVTSAGRGEGRTTTAVNLASAYAQSGKRTVLVDADIRNPGIHAVYGDSNTRGLTNVLNGTSELSEALAVSDMRNLSLLYAGPGTAQASDLLSSKEMDDLLLRLKREFDIVVVDAPPVIGHIDSKIVSAKCDGVVFVVQQGKVKRSLAKRSKEELERVKANILGVLMNKDKTVKV